MAIIYRARHTASGECYVGSTKNGFEARQRAHVRSLSVGNHHAKKFQTLWSLARENAFVWEVLEVCEDAKQWTREEWWLRNSESSLNSTKRARGGKSVGFGAVMSAAAKGRPANMTPARVEQLANAQASALAGGLSEKGRRARVGMKDTDDVKERRNAATRAALASKGKQRWVHRGAEERKIAATDPIPEGWEGGRGPKHSEVMRRQRGQSKTDDHRNAMSMAHLASNVARRASGQPHPNAGRKFFWATDGERSMRLPLTAPMPDGFQPGRTL